MRNISLFSAAFLFAFIALAQPAPAAALDANEQPQAEGLAPQADALAPPAEQPPAAEEAPLSRSEQRKLEREQEKAAREAERAANEAAANQRQQEPPQKAAHNH